MFLFKKGRPFLKRYSSMNEKNIVFKDSEQTKQIVKLLKNMNDSDLELIEAKIRGIKRARINQLNQGNFFITCKDKIVLGFRSIEISYNVKIQNEFHDETIDIKNIIFEDSVPLEKSFLCHGINPIKKKYFKHMKDNNYLLRFFTHYKIPNENYGFVLHLHQDKHDQIVFYSKIKKKYKMFECSEDKNTLTNDIEIKDDKIILLKKINKNQINIQNRIWTYYYCEDSLEDYVSIDKLNLSVIFQ